MSLCKGALFFAFAPVHSPKSLELTPSFEREVLQVRRTALDFRKDSMNELILQ